MKSRFIIPDRCLMRRPPSQKRSEAVIAALESATLALLSEQGYEAINTNAIAERAEVGIKSLYHFFPNKEAIVCNLAVKWLEAVHIMQADMLPPDKDFASFFGAYEQALATLNERYLGYGPLWHAMNLIPELEAIEHEHERLQILWWRDLLRHYQCKWPIAQLDALIVYMYRSCDATIQLATEWKAGEGQRIWLWHRSHILALLQQAIASPDADAIGLVVNDASTAA